jgi:hypothetical protein
MRLAAMRAVSFCSAIPALLLAQIEDSRHRVPVASRQDVLPVYIVFDEGNNISAFAVSVAGRSNVSHAHKWMANYFVPVALPILVDRLRGENASAVH